MPTLPIFNKSDKQIIEPGDRNSGAHHEHITCDASGVYRPCDHCGSTDFIVGPGRGPHAEGLRCADCGRGMRWLSHRASAYRAALRLVEQGLPCFPCHPDKTPATPHGFKDATRDPAALAALWSAYPGVLSGVPTGAVSGLSVLDIDAKHREAHEWWAEHRSRIPTTRVHRTRSGGLHHLFKTGLRCSTARLAPGIDTRGDGGYVVWWPATGCPVLRDTELADPPGWLIEVLQPPPPAAPPLPRYPDDTDVFRGLSRVVMSAAEGERNAVLFWAACRGAEHVQAGHVPESWIIEVLADAAVRAGLTQNEAMRSIQSAMRRGV